MKKNYFKPEITELNISSAILATSKLPVNPDITETPLSNRNQNRGEWGNVWK